VKTLNSVGTKGDRNGGEGALTRWLASGVVSVKSNKSDVRVQDGVKLQSVCRLNTYRELC